MMEERTMTDCELLVMKVIWESEEELSLRTISERVNNGFGKAWKLQTVSTFLTRLVHKDFLTMERRGRQFFYFPTISESEYGKKEIVKCVDFWHEGKISALLAAFTEVRELTEEDKDEIRRLVDER